MEEKPPKPDSPPLKLITTDKNDSGGTETGNGAVREDAGFEIDPEALRKLDTDTLREYMMQGIYTLEAALFTQSGYEYKRIGKLRQVVSEFEQTLFDPDFIKALQPKDKIKLYGLMLSNMNTSLSFLQNLHGNVTSGIEALSHIEKLKSQRTQPQSNVDHSKLDQVKKMVLEKMKKKVVENK